MAAATGAFVTVATLLAAASGDGEMTALGWVLIVSSAAVLGWRRRYPVAVLAATLLACSLYYPLTGPGSPIVLTFAVALFSAAARGRVAVAAGTAVLAVGLTVAGELATTEARHLDNISMFLMVGWFVAVIAVGAVVHGRRELLREAESRARVAEHGREAEAARRATEERLRIARELHDVLGHNISLINVQASAALHRLDRDGPAPDGSRPALAAIKDSSRQALRELRGTLGVLRQVDEAAPLAVPGLDAVDDLLDRARAAGLDVHREVSGEPARLPPGVDLAAYRIVQEALTNVTRHAGAGRVVVRISYTDEEVSVQVDDNGSGGTGTNGVRPGNGIAGNGIQGNGIQGMRERARALGGTLVAGARDGGGFRVLARLPLGAP
ncbi:sensor histidine kinase [Actinophytocola xinjiangensis]|uniref:sensor histidine kinase n=1 Tax=Actinophytocola xinjiangensis TaxID=485602 RepID=UPI000A62B2E2|nr:sensor histidine kinase [Actinophytocola xinjiangensis]